MVEIYKTDNKVLQKLDNIEEGCWVNMIDPTSSELSLVSGYFEIDLADLATALDEEESSRISLEDGYTLILWIYQHLRYDTRKRCIQQYH